MESSLEKIKRCAAEFQNQRKDSRTPYPDSFWDEVVEAAKELNDQYYINVYKCEYIID